MSMLGRIHLDGTRIHHWPLLISKLELHSGTSLPQILLSQISPLAYLLPMESLQEQAFEKYNVNSQWHKNILRIQNKVIYI